MMTSESGGYIYVSRGKPLPHGGIGHGPDFAAKIHTSMLEMNCNPQRAANDHQPRAITPATTASAATVAYAAPANLHEIVFPSTESENTLMIPNVQRMATTYGIGAPWVIAM